jgi:hypothetical protein
MIYDAWENRYRLLCRNTSLSEFIFCAEILPARIGMAFGICGRNKDADDEGANQEARKAGIIESLCQTLGVSQRRPTVSVDTADSTTARTNKRTRRLRSRLIFGRGRDGFVFAIRL